MSMYNSYRWSVKFRGREVRRQPWRGLTAALLVLTMIPLAALWLFMMLVVIPLSVPLHFLTKLFNGRGFSHWQGGKLTYEVPPWAGLLIIAALAYFALVVL